MQLFGRLRQSAPFVALSCALCSTSARAQSVSVDPEPSPLSFPRSAPAVDRGNVDSGERQASRRRDHLALGALVGVGFPRPLAVEGVVKLERTVLLGVEYSALPQISVSQVQASCWAVAGDLRVFPLRGPFFVGLRGGEQHIDVEASLSAYGYTVPAALRVDTVFLNPRLGFLWTWEPGISLGIDAGVQVPLSTNSASTLPKISSNSSAVTEATTSVRNSVESVGATIGQTVLPSVDLLRVGVLF